MIITYNEIKELTKGCYIDDGDEILVKHSVYNGEREFALVLIEMCLGLLSREKINDNFIVQYLQGLIALTMPDSKYYEDYLSSFVDDIKKREQALKGERLRDNDIALIKEMMQSNLGEYTMKGEYQSCCYSAMQAFFITTYCILLKNIDFNITNIDMIADLDDELESIQLYGNQEEQGTIIVDWHSTNKINSIYMLYKNEYPGLDKTSILDLVAADVIEKDYYFKDERFSIAPSILVKQYCGIIEHEVNELIQLKNLRNKPKKHLMWNSMKKYVKKNHIDLEFTSYKLSKVLDDLHDMRNDAAHGEIITKEQYSVISKYKNLGLFTGLSTEKLKLKNGKISPTIDELKNFMGLK